MKEGWGRIEAMRKIREGRRNRMEESNVSFSFVTPPKNPFFRQLIKINQFKKLKWFKILDWIKKIKPGDKIIIELQHPYAKH